MRATPCDSIGSPSSKNSSSSFRSFSALSLRRHQVASLEPSNEEELKLLDLLHSRLTNSLQSLLPLFTLSLPFLHKLLDAVLACESHFNSLLLLLAPRNPTLISHPPAVPDLLDRLVKSLDLCNAVSLSLHSLRRSARYADIAASALRRPPQFNRARRALSKLLSTGPNAPPSSSSCRRICSAKKHLQAAASSLAATHRSSESGGASVLSISVSTISTLLQFSMWVMVASFPCGGGEIQQPPPPIPSGVRNMPWALALSRLHDKVGENVGRERKKGGLLEETLAVERSGREVLEMVSNEEEIEGLAAELADASRRLEEGLGPFERKVREVFHRLVWCREEVIRCLGDRSGGSSLVSVDSV